MLTREEAIKKTREMWNWIATETKKQKRIVKKNYGYMSRNDFRNLCKLHCPLDFCGLDVPFACEKEGSPYLNWWNNRYKVGIFNDTEFYAAEYAKQIAELPERKIGDEDD